MAYTRIHAIKNTVNAAASYICDSSKTEGNTLVTSFAYSPVTAEHDFRFALSKTNENDKNLAYHLIQSFAPGEVSAKEAHAIGIELADQLLKGKYSYIVSTHTNTDSVHNHILFCAADNIDHRKFNSCRKSYRKIRSISDRLCAEHNLSIIQPDAAQSQDYRKSFLQLMQKESDWKNTLRNDIDDAIRLSADYGSFIELMIAKGYEMKGTSPEPGAQIYRLKPRTYQLGKTTES